MSLNLDDNFYKLKYLKYKKKYSILRNQLGGNFNDLTSATNIQLKNNVITYTSNKYDHVTDSITNVVEIIIKESTLISSGVKVLLCLNITGTIYLLNQPPKIYAKLLIIGNANNKLIKLDQPPKIEERVKSEKMRGKINGVIQDTVKYTPYKVLILPSNNTELTIGNVERITYSKKQITCVRIGGVVYYYVEP